MNELSKDNPELGALFPLLGVFPADFDFRAAAHVWDIAPRGAEKLLNELLDKSIIEGASRYRLHDLVRELAVSRADTMALEAARERHAVLLCQMLKQAAEGDGSTPDNLALFDASRANIEVGQAWSALHSKDNDRARDLILKFTIFSEWLTALRFTGERGLDWFETGRRVAECCSNFPALGIALESLGTINRHMGSPKVSIKHFECALEVHRTKGLHATSGCPF